MSVFFTAICHMKINSFHIWKKLQLSIYAKKKRIFWDSEGANLCFFVMGGRGCNFTSTTLGLEHKTFQTVQLVYGRFKSRTIFIL